MQKSIDTLGRIRLAEDVLKLIADGELPRFEQFIFNATINVYEVNDGVVCLQEETGADDVKRLLAHVRNRVQMRTTFDDGRVAFNLFHEQDIRESAVPLIDGAFRTMVLATYASIGLRIDVADHKLDITVAK